MTKQTTDKEKTLLEIEITKCAAMYPEISYAKLSRIAVRFYKLGYKQGKEQGL